MSNIGRVIKDFYCNGFAGRRYDLEGGVIEAEAHDWVIVRTVSGSAVCMTFEGCLPAEKQNYIDKWCGGQEDY
jgi:hypothetical protein